MPVLTQAEFSEKKKTIRKTELPKMVTPLPVVNEHSKKIYFLFHPENPRDNYINSFLKINWNGVDIEIPIENGIAKTKSPEIRDWMKGKGYIFIKEEDIE